MFDHNSLSITASTLSCAAIAAIHLGVLAFVAFLGHGVSLVQMIGELLSGYAPTGPGIFIGMVWGFLIGGIYGFIFSWLYNRMI